MMFGSRSSRSAGVIGGDEDVVTVTIVGTHPGRPAKTLCTPRILRAIAGLKAGRTHPLPRPGATSTVC